MLSESHDEVVSRPSKSTWRMKEAAQSFGGGKREDKR